MSGDRLLLDTNAVIALLRGEPSLIAMTAAAEWIGISIISQLEFLSFAGLSDVDRECFNAFSERVTVIGLSLAQSVIIREAVRLRVAHHLKLPDAVIAATAISQRAAIVTQDQHFAAVAGLTIRAF